jgi:hypothetical protein
MDPPANGTPGRDVLIEMIKAQMDSDNNMSQDQDAKRDAFLCLAVTIPPRQRARIKATMGPLLARARIKGSGRDPPPPGTAPDYAPGQSPAPPPDRIGSDNDNDIAAEIEARVGLMSSLCVLGCQSISYLPYQFRNRCWSIQSPLIFGLVWFGSSLQTRLGSRCMNTHGQKNRS